MKAGLELRQHQQLTMTPQLQQAIKLLQLSGDELEQEIQKQIAINPLLEYDSTSNDLHHEHLHQVHILQDNLYQKSHPVIINDENKLREDANEVYSDININHSIEFSGLKMHHESYEYNEFHEHREYQDQFSLRPMDYSLKQHLQWQARLSDFSLQEQQIAFALIDAIDDSGYLQQSFTEIQECTAHFGIKNVSFEQITTVLSQIQQYEPTGVAARNLSECLSIQLNCLPVNTPYLEQTKALVLNYLELLGKKDYKALKSCLKLNEGELIEVIDLVTKLNPKPGLKMSVKQLDFIVPDLIVQFQHHRFIVELNMNTIPRLHVNIDYANIIKQKDNHNLSVLRNYINEAQWFLKSIKTRQNTLLSVAQFIVEKQQAFFEQGEEALEPLNLQEVAEKLDIHESTVSRITQHKYMFTPRGVFELKFFFSNSLRNDNFALNKDSVTDTHEGQVINENSKQGISARALRAMIKKIILSEIPSMPLSDQDITDILAARGIHLARRTVSKYRIALKIPSSQDRRMRLSNPKKEC